MLLGGLSANMDYAYTSRNLMQSLYLSRKMNTMGRQLRYVRNPP
jgi:hypothetical protein